MDERKLKAGTRLLFGAPAQPMPQIMVDAIAQVVAQVSGIQEAHLPQCYIEGDQESRPVLVIGVRRQNEIPRIAKELGDKLQLLLPPRQFIDFFPFESGSLPAEVRDAGCRIFAGPKEA